MIEVAYTPENISPTEHDSNGNYIAHQIREYIQCRSTKQAEAIVKKLIQRGCFDIFIDYFDRDGDLIASTSFNLKT